MEADMVKVQTVIITVDMTMIVSADATMGVRQKL